MLRTTVCMAAAYLCNHTPEKTWSGAYLALAKLLQSARRYYRYWLGVALSTVPRKYPVLLNVITCRTLEGVLLIPRYARPVVR
jgi:uncharacterized membrane protein